LQFPCAPAFNAIKDITRVFKLSKQIFDLFFFQSILTYFPITLFTILFLLYQLCPYKMYYLLLPHHLPSLLHLVHSQHFVAVMVDHLHGNLSGLG
jgi:hypothetical protein